MLPYIKNDLKHNVNIIFSNRELFIADLAKRKQYQIARDMGLTSTQMSFFISIFWALKEAQDIHISLALEALDDTIVSSDSKVGAILQFPPPIDTAKRAPIGPCYGITAGPVDPLRDVSDTIPQSKDEEETE